MLQKNQQFVQGTEGPPIKKQLKSYAVETDSQLLAQHLEENSEAVGEILRRSSNIDMNERTMTRLVSKRLREYGMYGSVLSETAETIALLLEASKHPSVQGKDITADLTDTIKSALERTSYDFNPNKEDYDEVVQILKDHGDARVYLTADQEAHIREQGYDMRWLRNQYFGLLNVVKGSKYSESAGSSEIRLDDVYSDLSERFPTIFPMDDTPSRRAVDSSEYAMDILDKLDYLSRGHRLTIEEAFGADAQEVATRIMSEVVADVVQTKYNSRKNPYVESVIDKQRKLNNERTKKRVAEERRKRTEALQKQAEEFTKKNREVAKKAKERRTKTELRQKIKKLESELRKTVLHPTVKKFVPAELTNAVVDVLEVVNMDTVEADKRIALYDDLIAKANAKGDYAKAEELIVTRENIRQSGNRLKEKLNAVSVAYSNLKGKSENAAVYDEYLDNMINGLSEVVGDTPIRSMTTEQLQEVYDAFTGLKTVISNANKTIFEGKRRRVSELSRQVASEIKSSMKLKDKRALVVESASKVKWPLLKPYYAFENVGSETFKKMFFELQEGERTYARDVYDAKTTLSEARKKHNWRKWDHKGIETFELSSGKTIDLAIDQKIFIYNAWKREQYQQHILNGGFVFPSGEAFEIVKESKDGKKLKKSVLKYVHSTNDSYRMTIDDIFKITESLTDEQRAYADELEVYLSTTMSEKGNEVYRELYGFERYKEEHYTPIESASDYVVRMNKPAGEYTLKNMSASKETVPNAQNPVVLRGYDEVWVDHVDQMSMYHSLVIPIDTFNKIWNYSQYVNLADGENPWSVSTILNSAHGQGAVTYFTNFIRDLNGGVSVANDYTLASKLFATSKKVAVAASMSTIIQQPMAVIRAMSEINPVYFVIPKTSDGNKVNHFETIKKYAEVAILKEIGGFDAGGNRSAKDYINGTYTVMGHIDNAVMWGAQKADEFGWSNIWVAVINEQQAKYGVKLRNLSGEAREKFLKKCGDRFNEVIIKTQVYDSVFSRSAIMRSKNEWSKILTSFMGEPTTSMNMLYSAIVQTKRGNTTLGNSARKFASVYGSMVLTSIAASFIYAARDDEEEDKSFMEKWSYRFGNKLREEINPLNMLPFVRDIVSVTRGYSVDRPDVEMIESLWKSFEDLGKDDLTAWNKFKGFAGAVANLFGIPLKNVLRDGEGVYNFINDLIDDNSADSEEIGDAFSRGWSGKKLKKNATEIRSDLHKYLAAGRTDKAQEIKEIYEDDKKYHSAVRLMLRENDPRIEQAAKADIEGNTEERVRITNEIIESYPNEFVTQKDVTSAIKSTKEKLMDTDTSSEAKSEESTTPSYKQSLYNTCDINMAFDKGEKAAAKIFMDDIISAKTDEYMHKGKDKDEAQKEAKSYIRGAMTSYWKGKYQDAYISGNEAEKKRIKGIIEYSGVYSDGSKAVTGWEKELE